MKDDCALRLIQNNNDDNRGRNLFTIKLLLKSNLIKVRYVFDKCNQKHTNKKTN